MKIHSVRIQNFRSFEDETIDFHDYNCLVGPNGCGKSTVLNALNIFFRDQTSSSVRDVSYLNEEDFHCKKTDSPIRITVTFTDLSEAATLALKDYVRQDRLVVTAAASWSPESRSAMVVQRGSRLAIPNFAPFFKASADGQLVGELKGIYAEIRANHTDLPGPGTKAAMTEALKSYEQQHPERAELIESDDEFYGASKGAHKLGPFIQWVFVPAVKDASTEQQEGKNTAIGRLVARAVRNRGAFVEQIQKLRDRTSQAYDEILSDNQSSLDELSAALKQRLVKWAHPDVDLKVQWDRNLARSVQVDEPFAKIYAGESGFLGEMPRLGHGLQRSYILALLEELAATDVPEAPRLVLGIEEPELFQHPPKAQYLAELLQKLSAGNAQIAVCTHSPYFVVGKGFEDVILIRKPSGSTAKASRTTFQMLANDLVARLGEARFAQPTGIRAKLHQALRPAMREMFFCPTLVLVEGQEDIGFIHAGLLLSDRWENWRQCGAHVVAVNGKSEFIHPLAIAQKLGIPTFLMFDADGNTDNSRRTMHETDNARLLKLLGRDGDSRFPAADVWGENFVIWPENIGESIKRDYLPGDWERWKQEVEQELGHAGNLDKNSLFIASILAKAWDEGKSSSKLEKLCDQILKFAQQTPKQESTRTQ
jgi:putative ATP-dependent endonuclease of the OLD family